MPIQEFPTSINAIMQRLNDIKPVSYGRNRNFIDGDVSRLSPYISRGVISTKMVLHNLLEQHTDVRRCEKFIQELAWRDYWQHQWLSHGHNINQDLKHSQQAVENHQISAAIVAAQTGIEAIDTALKAFYQTGYLHNHVRMYVASMACNIANSHWLHPAQWMYYHLLDGDWASNALSWQWVAGSNSNKKYLANQQNINKYCHSKQSNSFLDVSYATLAEMPVPDELATLTHIQLSTHLPKTSLQAINPDLPTLIYNYYNLDPNWHAQTQANRILLLEPEVFAQFPISDQAVQFMLDLAENIPDMQVYTGSFESLQQTHQLQDVIYKEHPLNQHYVGQQEPRDWMFAVAGDFASFFKFWKPCKQQLNEMMSE